MSASDRKASRSRNTLETRIRVDVDLDGTGQAHNGHARLFFEKRQAEFHGCRCRVRPTGKQGTAWPLDVT